MAGHNIMTGGHYFFFKNKDRGAIFDGYFRGSTYFLTEVSILEKIGHFIYRILTEGSLYFVSLAIPRVNIRLVRELLL